MAHFWRTSDCLTSYHLGTLIAIGVWHFWNIKLWTCDLTIHFTTILCKTRFFTTSYTEVRTNLLKLPFVIVKHFHIFMFLMSYFKPPNFFVIMHCFCLRFVRHVTNCTQFIKGFFSLARVGALGEVLHWENQLFNLEYLGHSLEKNLGCNKLRKVVRSCEQARMTWSMVFPIVIH